MASEYKHRTTWVARVADPKRQMFLPTAPPQMPRKSKAAAPAPAPAPAKKRERLTEGPPESRAPGAVNIRDRENDYRGYIAPDGTCYNNMGDIIGYINVDTNEAGAITEEYLGCLKRGSWEDEMTCEDDMETVVGTLDRGKATLKNADGSTMCQMNGAGECKGNAGTYLGQFEPFDYHDLPVGFM
eukprot:CAMPEP_0177659996 /NCGR_PEP_ID=MMETSP0447-20121125/17762_1 /TAXON_ID=0 /ORGANISM="Stygamoeba regulata, Strain BSH-02190019" /LENGTH=184 /DNA_ID=CAMNT_0019164947 /DNA_START=63 /DNA_END=617 /DNA_ORIENTATION=-